MWIYKTELIDELPNDVVGFVYLITNTQTLKKYIGKKLTHYTQSRPPLKGKTRRRHIRKPSDWPNYWGSSTALSADILHLGQKHFTREILHLCYSRAECNYLEAKEQFCRSVLETDEYYNSNIQVRVHSSTIANLRLK